MYKQFALMALAVGALGAPVQAASLNNGNFETGTLSPWTSSGSASVQQTATYGGSGANVGLLRNDGPFATATNLESFLGLGNGALSALGNGTAISGAAIQQTTITVNTGESLSFAWNFLTNEFPGETTTQDFAFYTINGQAFTLASTASNLSPYTANTSFDNQTDFQTKTLALAPGTYTFGFGVVNVFDTSTSSGLLVDNVAVVPEPDATTAITVLGLGAFWLRQRRVRNS